MEQLEIIEENGSTRIEAITEELTKKRRLTYVVKCVYRDLRCIRRRCD